MNLNVKCVYNNILFFILKKTHMFIYDINKENGVHFP